MKITALETIRLAEFANLLWLRVHTSEGLVGLGETFFCADTVEAGVHEAVAAKLLERDRYTSTKHLRTSRLSRISLDQRGNARRVGFDSLWDFSR
jgi:L-alanine-DL-glutamate epimerase-like enolase superfamily enzyme